MVTRCRAQRTARVGGEAGSAATKRARTGPNDVEVVVRIRVRVNLVRRVRGVLGSQRERKVESLFEIPAAPAVRQRQHRRKTAQ